MKTFRLARGLFYDVIAAPSREAAQELARVERGRDGPMIEILTPDTWTRRAAEAAAMPSIIDTVPRWIVEGEDGHERELDVDDLPRTTEAQRAQLRGDSPTHTAWLDAISATEAGGEALRKLVVDVATERDPKVHARKARALAAACGLGPVPQQHVLLLPALIAIDATVDALDRCGLTLPIAWFELDRAPLIAAVEALAVDARRARVHEVWLAANDISEARGSALVVLSHLGWLRK